MARAIRISKTHEPTKYEIYDQYNHVRDIIGKRKSGQIKTIGLEHLFFTELDYVGLNFKDLNKNWPKESLSDAYLTMLDDFGTMVSFNQRDPRLKKMERFSNSESKYRLFSYLLLFDRFKPTLTAKKWGSRNVVSTITNSSDSSVMAGLESMVSGKLLRRFQDPSYGETQAAYFYNMTTTGRQELYDSIADIELLDKPENPKKSKLWRGKKYSVLIKMYGKKMQNLVRTFREYNAIERLKGKHEDEIRYHITGEKKKKVARNILEKAELEFAHRLKRRGAPYKTKLIGF